jgi:hypothetical protein
MSYWSPHCLFELFSCIEHSTSEVWPVWNRCQHVSYGIMKTPLMGAANGPALEAWLAQQAYNIGLEPRPHYQILPFSQAHIPAVVDFMRDAYANQCFNYATPSFYSAAGGSAIRSEGLPANYSTLQALVSNLTSVIRGRPGHSAAQFVRRELKCIKRPITPAHHLHTLLIKVYACQISPCPHVTLF